jgi:hypothetical protein
MTAEQYCRIWPAIQTNTRDGIRAMGEPIHPAI